MLTRDAILENIRLGNIIIQPFKQDQLNPNSYNITLNPKLKVYDLTKCKDGILDIKEECPTKEIIIPEEGYVLRPNILYLGRTNEYTETYNLVAALDGRSSIGRFGTLIHMTAGFGDIGFTGTWTLEIAVTHPIRIYPNIQIGQLYWQPIEGKPTNYKGRYNGQIEPTPSRLFKDYER